jgi:hypothetical protein
VIAVFYIVLALVGAEVSKHRKHRRGEHDFLGVDVFLVWWIVVTLGLASIVGAAFHIFDGPATAEQIGYTRGDGGFQFENAMGDLAIGITAVLAVRLRGMFWLAVILVAAIQFYGDAGGHIYFWLAENDTEPDNIGGPLILDIVGPTVAAILFWSSWRRGGDARPHSS